MASRKKELQMVQALLVAPHDKSRPSLAIARSHSVIDRPAAFSYRVGGSDCLANVFLRCPDGLRQRVSPRQLAGQGRGEGAPRAVSRAGLQVQPGEDFLHDRTGLLVKKVVVGWLKVAAGNYHCSAAEFAKPARRCPQKRKQFFPWSVGRDWLSPGQRRRLLDVGRDDIRKR